MGIPHMTGKGATVQCFFGPELVDEFDVERWEVQRQGDRIEDGVCGEIRTRKDFETTGYSLSVSLFNKKTTKLDLLLTDQADLDAFTVPDPKTIGIILKAKDGTKKSYALGNGTIDDWRIGAAGQTARVMMDLPIRFDTFETV